MLRRFFRDRKGNVAIIFALSLIPCIFLAGMALDFTVATQRRVLLNSAADAAALAAVTPTMMQQSSTNAQTAAIIARRLAWFFCRYVSKTRVASRFVVAVWKT